MQSSLRWPGAVFHIFFHLWIFFKWFIFSCEYSISPGTFVFWASRFPISSSNSGCCATSLTFHSSRHTFITCTSTSVPACLPPCLGFAGLRTKASALFLFTNSSLGPIPPAHSRYHYKILLEEAIDEYIHVEKAPKRETVSSNLRPQF